MGIWRTAAGWLELRPLSGHDERSVAGTSVLDALALIDRLNVARQGALVAPGEAGALAVPLRDRLLAWIYTQSYGDLVSSSPRCVACGERYDLSFSLPELLKAHPLQAPAPDGVYQTSDGTRFRLPSGLDELAVLGLSASAARLELLKRCALSGDGRPETLEAALEVAAPLLSMELQAGCPECGQAQPLAFDMGGYLLRRLLSDQQRLPGEVHTLAMVYGWGHGEILSLTRAERRRYIALIEASLREGQSRRSSGSRRRIG